MADNIQIVSSTVFSLSLAYSNTIISMIENNKKLFCISVVPWKICMHIFMIDMELLHVLHYGYRTIVVGGGSGDGLG